MMRILALFVTTALLASDAFAGIICNPGSEIAITYEELGKELSARKVFKDEPSNAQAAVTQYQAYVKSFGSGKVKKVTRTAIVSCSNSASFVPMTLSASSRERSESVGELELTVTNTGKSCRTTYPSEDTVMVECDDGSQAVYSRAQDAVFVKPAGAQLYEKMDQQTQAMNALMNQADLLSRKDWKTASLSVTVGGADFEKVLDAIKIEAAGGPRFPKPEDLAKKFSNFKLDPLNDAMERTFRQQQGRLQRFSKVNNSFSMTKGQVEAYFERFVQGLARLDDLSQRNSQAFDNETNKLVSNFMSDLVVSGQGSPFATERRAAAKAVLDSFAPNGIIPRPQNSAINSLLGNMNLKTSLDDPDLSRREYAAELRSALNRISAMAIRGSAALLKKSLVALDWAGNADVAFSGLTEGDEVKGIRFLDRLNAFFEYGQGKRPPVPGLSAEESVLFHLGQLQNTFENSEVVKAVKELANEAGLLEDPYYRFHAVLAVNEALRSATDDRFGDFSVHIENAYAALDCYRGYGNGLALSVWSTAEGAYKIVAHPFNSAYAVGMSMINYEDTWSAFKKTVAEKYETVKNCESNNYECGKVVGQVAGDIAQVVGGLAVVKGTVSGAVIAEGSEMAARVIVDEARTVTQRAARVGVESAEEFSNFVQRVEQANPCGPGNLGCDGTGGARKIGDALAGIERSGDIGDVVPPPSATKNLPAETSFWPKDRAGFLHGWSQKEMLPKGFRTDRFGGPKGIYLSPEGTPFTDRALPAEWASRPYRVYEVIEPFEVEAGLISPWFGQRGMGIQYMLLDDKTVADLLGRYLRDVTPPNPTIP